MESINFITPSKEYPKTETNNIQIDHFNGKLKFKWTLIKKKKKLNGLCT